MMDSSNIDNSTQHANDFDANLGGLSLNEILPDSKPKGRKPCDKGDECAHFKLGKCKFYHPKPDNGEDDISAAAGKPKQSGHKKPPCKDGPACKHLANGNCKFYHPKSFGPQDKQAHPRPANGNKDFTPRTPCRNGPACPRLANGTCTYLHDPSNSQASAGSNPTPKAKASIDRTELLLSLPQNQLKKVLALPEELRNAFLDTLA